MTSRSPPPGPTVLDRLQDAGVAGPRRRQDPGHLLGSGHHGGPLLGLQRPRGGPDAGLPAAAPGPRSCSRTSWTSTPSTAIATTPPATRPAIEAFDRRLPELIGALDGGVLLITGDHGCDPTTRAHGPLARTNAAAGGGPRPGRDRSTSARGSRSPTWARRWPSSWGSTEEGLEGSSFVDLLGIEASS